MMSFSIFVFDVIYQDEHMRVSVAIVSLHFLNKIISEKKSIVLSSQFYCHAFQPDGSELNLAILFKRINVTAFIVQF